MQDIGVILYVLIGLYILSIIIRLITEMVEAFSREFRPPRWFIFIAEPIFVITDPPLKLLRRWIRPLQAGGMGLDFSPIVLFFVLQVLQVIVLQTMVAPR